MGTIGTAAVQSQASRMRRRRARAAAGAPPPPPPPPPAVSPVPGTAAAQAARDAAERAARQRPHVLLDPDPASRPKGPKAGMPEGMSPGEIADRIVAKLLPGSGPILLCVPGTLGSSYESSMLAAARAFVAVAEGPVSVASIPYPNGVMDVVPRFFRIGTQQDDNVLALVLQKLRVAAPGRPIMLTGESQGAWLIAETLREDPELAAAVTRVALFAKPGFAKLPEGIGTARMGAALLRAAPDAPTGVLEFRHTDDIVPSLFSRLGPQVLMGYVEAFAAYAKTGDYGYPPHHYDDHGLESARWLLLGERPAADPVHHSKVHRRRSPVAAS